MGKAKQAAAVVQDDEEPITFAGERPRREVDLLKPFAIQDEYGRHLQWGERHTVSALLADQLVLSGRAIDVATGERHDVRKAPVQISSDNDNALADSPSRVPLSGRKARVKVLAPFSFQLEGGRIVTPGDEFIVPIELVHRYMPGVERVDIEKRPEKRSPMPAGEPHPVRVTAGGVPGAGIWVVSLDRHVEYGEEISVPESEATILIAMQRVVSLRPETPSPAAVELAELLAPDDEEKQGKVAVLAHRILRGRIS